MKIHILSEYGDTHWYRLVANNGHTLMTSEMYANKGNAVRAAKKTARALGLTWLDLT